MKTAAETANLINPDYSANKGRLGLFGLQILTEVVSARRNVEYVVGLVIVPALLYSMFGLPNDSTWVPGGSTFSTIALGSFAAYGVVSLAIFTFVDELAKERGRGWIRTLRATPVSFGSYLLGKISMAAVYSLLILVVLAVISVPTGASSLSVTSWLSIAALGVGGVIIFGTVGIAVAFLVRPRAATTIANLVFLPLAFCSGFFFPLSEIPAFVRDIAPFLPTYHYGRLVWSRVATDEEIDLFTGIAGEQMLVHVGWVFGFAVIGATLAWWATRRDAVTRR
jgi:ABC-2 type transport system permease protein